MDGLLGDGDTAAPPPRTASLIVRVTGAAAGDLADIEAWLLARSISAAQRLTAALREALTSLMTLPDRGRPGMEPGTRELVVRRYLITYRVDGHEVIVLHIRHHARLR